MSKQIDEPNPFPIVERRKDHQGKTWLFSEDEAIKQLPTIERMIKGLASLPTKKRSLDDEFIEEISTFGTLKGSTIYRVRQDSRFQQIRSTVKTLNELRSHNYSLSHHAHAFISHFFWCVMDVWEKKQETYSRGKADEAIILLDGSITSLNKEVSSVPFRAKVGNADELGRQRTKKLKAWMRKAFRRSHGLLLIHLQLSRVRGKDIDFYEATNDRNCFFDNWRRNPLFNHLIGYVFKLNFHPQKGIVHDIFLFYDAVLVREAASLMEELENFWLSITWSQELGESMGKAWHDDERLHLPRSHEQQSQKMPFTKRILFSEEEESKKRLKDIIFYLSYYDTYLSYHLPQKIRTFGTSELTERKKRKSKKKESIKTQPEIDHSSKIPINQPFPNNSI